MFQALYKKIHCDFHIYNPGVISLVSHWKLGSRRPETKYFMGKESTCHDPERKPRNQHEISSSHGFHDVQKKMSLQNLRTSLSILKHLYQTKIALSTDFSRILLKYTPPLFFSTRKMNDAMVLVKHPFPNSTYLHLHQCVTTHGSNSPPGWQRNPDGCETRNPKEVPNVQTKIPSQSWTWFTWKFSPPKKKEIPYLETTTFFGSMLNLERVKLVK